MAKKIKIPKFPYGGATTQDSLDVYKNAIKVSEYYNKSGKYKKMGEIPTNNIFQRLNNDVKNFSGLAAVNESSPYFPNQPITKHLQKTDYHKDLDNNKFLQRETANNILDMSAPMTLFDKRITPQKTETYQNQKQNDLLVGDMVGLYTYDPIAVKPVSMLTPAERKEREKKYPNSFGKPTQPVILKKEVKVPVPKVDYLKNLPTEQDSKIDILGNNVQYQNEPTQETTKGKPLNDFLIQTVKTPNGMKIYKRKDTNSPFIEQYKYGGKIKKYPLGGDSGEGMGAGSIVSTVGNALDTVGNFIPVDNDGRGVSKTGQAVSGGIQTGLDSAADIANSIPGGQIIGGALKIGSFLTKGITAIVDAVKERKHPTDELVNEKYSPTYKDSSFSFGNNILALGGDTSNNPQNQFKQYDTVSHAEGGQNIDANNNPTANPHKAKAEIEKQENSYKNYVFSDELGFAKLAAKINKKYDGREDLISKNSLDIELTGLMKKNEKVKTQIEQNQKLAQNILKLGGLINNKRNYEAVNKTMNNSIYSPDGKFFTNEDQYKRYQDFYNPQELIQPIINNYNKLKIKNNNFQFKYGGKIKKMSKGGFNDYPSWLSDIPQYEYQSGAVPVPNVDFLKGIALSDNIIEKDEEVKRINNLKDILQNNFNLREVPEPPNNGEGDLPKTEAFKKQFSPEAIAGYGIKGIEMLGHAIQAFKKPDLVNPVYNPEENKVKSLMSNRKFDSQAILDALDLQDTANRQNINDNSTSVGVIQANLQKANANQVNAIANTKIQEQQTNNQYRADEAQVLNNLGQQKMQAQVYAEEVNAKSKANVQVQRDKFLKESIGGLGDFLLKKDYVNKDNNFQMNILKSKGINFEATDYNDWNKAGVDIAKFTGELESETDTAKRKAKMEEVHQKFLAKGGTEESWQSNSIAQGLTNKYLK